MLHSSNQTIRRKDSTFFEIPVARSPKVAQIIRETIGIQRQKYHMQTCSQRIPTTLESTFVHLAFGEDNFIRIRWPMSLCLFCTKVWFIRRPRKNSIFRSKNPWFSSIQFKTRELNFSIGYRPLLDQTQSEGDQNSPHHTQVYKDNWQRRKKIFVPFLTWYGPMYV